MAQFQLPEFSFFSDLFSEYPFFKTFCQIFRFVYVEIYIYLVRSQNKILLCNKVKRNIRRTLNVIQSSFTAKSPFFIATRNSQSKQFNIYLQVIYNTCLIRIRNCHHKFFNSIENPNRYSIDNSRFSQASCKQSSYNFYSEFTSKIFYHKPVFSNLFSKKKSFFFNKNILYSCQIVLLPKRKCLRL